MPLHYSLVYQVKSNNNEVSAMSRIRTSLTSLTFACALGFTSLFAGSVSAYQPHDKVDSTDMFLDAVAVRPLTLAGTIVGGVAFIIGSPFSAIGGNLEESFDQLVVEPAKYTFVRPLGHMTEEPLAKHMR
jgi:hypothetical protein